MKKFLCTLCIVAMLISNFTFLAFASDFLCVLETFENGASDAIYLPAGASVAETADGRRVMALNGDLNSTWVQARFNAISGLFMASCQFMQPQYATADVCRVLNSTGGSEIARVYIEGGNIKVQSGNNGITLGAYNTNMWYRIDIIGDTSTKTGTVYIDGIERGSFGFIKPAAFDVGNLHCFNRGNALTYIDNMYLLSVATVESALFFAESFGDTLNNVSMYSKSGLDNVFEAFAMIASSTNEEELENAKAYLEECKYKVLSADGSGDYTKSINPESQILVSETEFKVGTGGGGNVLSLSDESGSGFSFLASESDGLVLKCADNSEISIADSLVADSWYSMKVISDSHSNKMCVILNGAVVFNGDAELGIQNISSVGVSGIDGYEGLCIIGGAVSVTESADYDISKDILRAQASLDFYSELYSEEEISCLKDALSVFADKDSLAEDKEKAFDKIRNTAFDLQHKMSDSSSFCLGKSYETDNLDGFGVFEGSFAVISDSANKTVVFEPTDAGSGNAFCSLFVKNGSLYAESDNGEILLSENLETFKNHKLMAVVDVAKNQIRVFLNDVYLEVSEAVECSGLADSVNSVLVKLDEADSSIALRGGYTLNKVTGADIYDINSMDKLEFAVRVSDFIRDVNNSSRSSIGNLIADNEKMLYDYGLTNDYKSLTDAEKSSVCLNIINKSFESVEDITEELNIQIDNLYMQNQNPSHFGGGGGGSSSGSNRVSVSKPVSLTVPETPSVQLPGSQETSTPAVNGYKFPFEDIGENHWSFAHIKALNEKGIIKGVSETLFSPDSNVKREEFIKLVVSAFNINTVTGYSAFNDVSSGAWYAPYINAAHQAGIVNGDDNGCFGVGKDITREEMFTIIYRVALSQGADFSAEDVSSSYSDFEDVSDYAKDAVSALIADGLVSGMTDSIIAPKATATRAMAAKLAHMLVEKGWGL